MTALDRPASSSWLELASCKGRPTSWWYPARGDVFAVQVARAICRGCPVRRQCLADALAVEDEDALSCCGIRGGLTPAERRRLVRRAG